MGLRKQLPGLGPQVPEACTGAAAKGQEDAVGGRDTKLPQLWPALLLTGTLGLSWAVSSSQIMGQPIGTTPRLNKHLATWDLQDQHECVTVLQPCCPRRTHRIWHRKDCGPWTLTHFDSCFSIWCIKQLRAFRNVHSPVPGGAMHSRHPSLREFF